MDAYLLLFVAGDKIHTEQLRQLEVGSNASTWETIEPLLGDALYYSREIPVACRIIHILNVHLCLVNVQMVVWIRGSIKQINRRHFYFAQSRCFEDFSAERCYQSRAGAPFNGVSNLQGDWVNRSMSFTKWSFFQQRRFTWKSRCLSLLQIYVESHCLRKVMLTWESTFLYSVPPSEPSICNVLLLCSLTSGTRWMGGFLLFHIPCCLLFPGRVGGSN